ncbi:MAG: hypothetical protein WKF81_14835, partial [Thermomicrobiales bacterium]
MRRQRGHSEVEIRVVPNPDRHAELALVDEPGNTKCKLGASLRIVQRHRARENNPVITQGEQQIDCRQISVAGVGVLTGPVVDIVGTSGRTGQPTEIPHVFRPAPNLHAGENDAEVLTAPGLGHLARGIAERIPCPAGRRRIDPGIAEQGPIGEHQLKSAF